MSIQKQGWTPACCFFAVAVAYTIGWTACSSELTYFSQLYGPRVLLYMNFAYFAPSVPIMVMQNFYDSAFNASIGIAAATCFRLVIGLGGAAVVMATFPFHTQSMALLLTMVSALGIFSGIAFGSSYQLVSRFKQRESVALTTGFVGSGPVILLLEASLHMGSTPTFHQRVVLYWVTAAVILGGLLAGLLLLSRSWKEMRQESSAEDVFSMPGSPEAAPISARTAPAASVGRRQVGRQYSRGTAIYADASQYGWQHDKHRASMDDSFGHTETTHVDDTLPAGLESIVVHTSNSIDRESSLLLPLLNDQGQLPESAVATYHRSVAIRLLRLWPVATALFLSASTSVLLFPFFVYVPMETVWPLGIMLPQLLFAARLVADVIGRLSPKPAAVQSPMTLLWFSVLRVATTPLFMIYVADPSTAPPMVAVFYVAIFWWSSGYINTIAFLVAPKLVSKSLRARSGAVMALTFQASCLVALVAALGLQAVLPANAGQQNKGFDRGF